MHRLKQRFGSQPTRTLAAVVVLLLTFIIFWRFLAGHPEYFAALKHVKAWTILAILALNAGVIISLVFVYHFTLRLCGKRLPFKEQFLLTAYSSLANFFGPFQSGPGVRAVYLKTKHQVRLRDYTLATMVYYAMFCLISALFLFGGSRPWWQTAAALMALGAVCWTVIWRIGRNQTSRFRLDGRALAGLFIATLAQVCFVGGYYFIELLAVHPETSFHQALTYTGAANFALFVSLTPDAIGLREAFLVLSQRLHHLATGVIVAANLLDRAVYAVFLVLLFLAVSGLHAKYKLGLKRAHQQ